MGRMITLGRPGLAFLVGLALFAAGCHTVQVNEAEVGLTPLPRELSKQTLPDYVIEPPDIVLIDDVSAPAEQPTFRVGVEDVLGIEVPNAFETAPIKGSFPVEPDGTVNLGAKYGTVRVAGKTITEVRAAIRDYLAREIKNPRVLVTLEQTAAVAPPGPLQQIRGQHLVTPDGSVRLGVYGAVKIAGMTVNEARQAIEAHLHRYVKEPKISLDVAAYNSKLFYVIFDGGGSGQQIVRLPVTGGDTVLDAIAQAGGLTPVSSEHQIWVARPAPVGSQCDQVLPVDWCGITTRGRTETNYQLMPGDRIYVKANALVTIDTLLARAISPVERLFGIVLLGNTTVRSFRNNNGNNGFGNNNNNFGPGF